MKRFLYIPLFLVLLASCATVNVTTDYDTNAQFTNYKSFAFFKPSVDQMEISDLDKKRIMRAVEGALITKGFQKSANPDVLIALSSDAEKNVRVYPNNFGWGWGWGWNPFWMGGNFMNTYETTEGILHIDVVDAKKKELIWRGTGKAPLVEGPREKTERINEIVTSILAEYPPMIVAK